jgi:putative transposase
VRAEHAWPAAGSQTVQQQALRDFNRAMAAFFAGTRGRPTWRKAIRNEGFRIVAVKAGHVQRLSGNVGQVLIPKVGYVRFRLSRPVPKDVKSFRVTCDRAGRWRVAFAAVPRVIPGPA